MREEAVLPVASIWACSLLLTFLYNFSGVTYAEARSESAPYAIAEASPLSVAYLIEPEPDGAVHPDHYMTGGFAGKPASGDNPADSTEAEIEKIVDTEPPVISGDLDREVFAGSPVSYRSGVTVTDNLDPNPKLTVDSSGVNPNMHGEYTVIYTATDESGNKSVARGVVTVKPTDMSLVNEIADGILTQILTDNMSQREKAREIFIWVTRKMKYAPDNNPRDLAAAAYACLTKGTGDCYVYKSGSEVLLTRAGIRNTEIKRSGGDSEHYWNLVNTGDGWFHFDTCVNSTVPNERRFMFTESQAREYTGLITNIRGYYDYDKSEVPMVEE